MFARLFAIILLVIPLWLHADVEKPIPVDQAFILSIKPNNTDSINLHWKIAPDYYLYKNRISVKLLTPPEASLGMIYMPPGIAKTDTILGPHSVYEKELIVSLPVLNPTNQPLKLLVNYQGCAASGFCYPPQSKLITLKNLLSLTANDITIEDYIRLDNNKNSKISMPSEQTKIEGVLRNKNSFLALSIFFGLGLLLSFTPCVLPMIPILSGIIIGQGKKLSTKKALALSLTYVLGMALSFTIAGILVGFLGSNIQAAMQKPWIIILFSLFFVALAFSLFGFYEIQLPKRFHHKIHSLSHKQKNGTYFGVFMMGALSSLVVSPCVTAPLVGALTYIGQTGNALFGGLALFTLALGMGLPLLILGASFGKFLPKAGHWMHAVKAMFGFMMLGMAIWMLTRILPGAFSLFLWGCLSIIAAVFMGAVSKTPQSIWGKICKSLGIVLLVYGVVLVIGAAMGNSDVFNPLHSQRNNLVTNQLNFIPVKSLADVKHEINQAKLLNKPVMLDFYADWCVACKEMDKYTFSNDQVRAKLNHYRLLRADVTANDAMDKELMQYYGVIAPPTILFFNKKAEHLSAATIVGEMNAEKFLEHLP